VARGERGYVAQNGQREGTEGGDRGEGGVCVLTTLECQVHARGGRKRWCSEGTRISKDFSKPEKSTRGKVGVC
jgi:hypothetical protein